MPRNGEILGNYITGIRVHAVIVTASAITPDKLSVAELMGFALATSSCKEDQNTRGGGGGGGAGGGGGGGGVLIYVHTSVLCAKRG